MFSPSPNVKVLQIIVPDWPSLAYLID